MGRARSFHVRNNRRPASARELAWDSFRVTAELGWTVWRQDDNGNRFEVRRLATREEAESLAAEFEARGHKQFYWVERTVPPGR